MRVLYWVAIFTFLADQASKYYVVHWLRLINDPDGRITVLPGYLEYRMAWNRGVNFGLFADFDMRWALVSIALVISLFVLIWLHKRGNNGRWLLISGGLLVGGALGNVLDRVFYGAVADFLNVTCCGINNPFAFNVADIAIFVGAIGLALLADDKPKSGG